MSTYRLNLTIDEEFAKILGFFKANFPLLSDVEIIKMLVSQSYVAKKQIVQKSSFEAWSETLPIQKLTLEQEVELGKSVASGTAGAWNSQEFLTEMMS